LSAGDITAVYAAVVATCVLLWQIRTFGHARRTDVYAHFNQGIERTSEHGGWEHRLTVVVINRGEHSEQIAHLTVQPNTGTDFTLIDDEDEPVVLAPRARTSRTLRPASEGLDLDMTFSAFVGLGSGKWIKVDPVPVDPALRDFLRQADEHGW
jgi:hypothetical protein